MTGIESLRNVGEASYQSYLYANNQVHFAHTFDYALGGDDFEALPIDKTYSLERAYIDKNPIHIEDELMPLSNRYHESINKQINMTQ